MHAKMSSPVQKAVKPIAPLDQLQVYRFWGTLIAVVTLVIITTMLITSEVSPLEIMPGTTPQEQMAAGLVAVTPSETSSKDPVVQAFIVELQDATTRAAGVGAGSHEGVWFNRARWHRENSCMSRTELPEKYSRRKDIRDLESNPQWRAVLHEYAKLHRTCMHRVGNATAYFMSQNKSIECRFTIVDTDEIGLGNRFLVVASAVMYSVLTKRVILLAGDDDFIPHNLLCQPFEGSSWRGFDVHRNVTPFRGEPNAFWNLSNTFHDHIDQTVRESTVLMDHYAIANIDVQNWYGQPPSRFFCDREQEHYKNVTFLYLTGVLYFLPKFFTVPSFRPLLEALFPDRMVLTQVLREVMLPADAVWTRVKLMDHGYLQQADRRLGIQLRYRGMAEEYNSMHDTVAARVLQCAIANNILPLVESNADSTDAQRSQLRKAPLARTIGVYIASLYEGVKSNLTETFLRHPTVTGDTVQVVQLSAEGAQKFGGHIFQAALAEVLLLSVSDFLFVTPRSTFSGLAQAYGGLVPWFIDWRQNVSAPCTRAQTVDVCYQVPFDYHIKCPADPSRHEQPVSAVFPDLQRCLAVDCMGLQLITTAPLSLPPA